MTILQLCHKPPYPSVDGGTIAMHQVTKGLLKLGHKVKVLALHTHKHPLNVSELPAEYVAQTAIETVFVDTRIKPVDALKYLVSGTSYNIARFCSEEFSSLIEKTISRQNFDIVHFESLFTAPYTSIVRKHSGARLVYRAHNVEYEIWEKMAQNCGISLKKIYMSILSTQLRKYETSAIKKFDGIAAISPDDAAKLKGFAYSVPVIAFPAGIEIPDVLPSPRMSKDITQIKLFYIGSFDWMPNTEGVLWFLRNSWPLIHSKNKHIRMVIAGRSMPSIIRNYKTPNITIMGEVPDARSFMNENDVMIVPLLSGSGIRIKIIEAMSLGKPVVATPAAASGIPYRNGCGMVVAKEPKKLAEEVLAIASDRNDLHAIGEKAFRFAKQHYNNNDAIEKLTEFYRQLSGGADIS